MIIKVKPRRSEAKRVITAFLNRKLSVIGLVLIALFILTAIFAPWLAPHDPYQINMGEAMMTPGSQHLLGTDTLGRDTLSRIIYGSRTSLMIGVLSVILGAFVGMSLGLVAGYFGGWVNLVIMRFIDALMCMPPLLNALIISVVLGGGILNVVLALAVGIMPGQARLMCAQTLTVKQNDYITYGRAMGAVDLRMLLRHILPNAFPPLLVAITIDLGMCVLLEGALSFLGVGIAPPTIAWGSMINNGYPYLLTNWEMAIMPGFALMLVIFGFNMTGDGLRDAFDPRLR